MCRNTTTLNACNNRTDPLAHRVCDWQGGLFCLSTRATSNESSFELLTEAIIWMVSRNKVEESGDGITACLQTIIRYAIHLPLLELVQILLVLICFIVGAIRVNGKELMQQFPGT